MSDLQQQMKQDMQLRGFSERTQYKYLMNLRHFQEYFGQPPESLATKEVKDFLHYLITVKKVSSSYVNGVYSALRFFFETTLGQTWDMKKIPRCQKSKKLPVALSRDEIRQVLAVTTNLKFKAIFMIAYAAGLRVSEIAHLKLADIDSENMQILVKQGKGNIDRFSVLSPILLTTLREYWKVFRPKDWLFPGKIPGQHIGTRAIQDAFLKMRVKAGIKKKGSIHSLRHSFATHLLEDGVNILYIQQFLGHVRLSTTTIYLHLAKVKMLQVKSPLDSLEGEE